MLLKPGRKIATMNEIAAACGVSLSTVYRILRNPERVRTPQQQSVRGLLMQNHYLPEFHPANAVTILNVTLKGAFVHISSFHLFLQKVCLERKINLVLCEYEDVQEMIRQVKPAGLIFNFMPKGYRDFNLPLVVVRNGLNSCVCTSVGVDDIAGICCLFAKLKELGHRRIFYFSPLMDARTMFYPERCLLERAQTFYQVNNLPFDEKLCCFRRITPRTHDEVMSGVVDYFLNLPDRPTAIVTAGDVYCEAFYTRFRQLGIRIPEDISIAGFDNIRRYQNFLQAANPITKRSFDLYPPVTTCDLPEEIAACAIDLLLEKIGNPLVKNKKVLIMPDVIITNSIGKVNQKGPRICSKN